MPYIDEKIRKQKIENMKHGEAKAIKLAMDIVEKTLNEAIIILEKLNLEE